MSTIRIQELLLIPAFVGALAAGCASKSTDTGAPAATAPDYHHDASVILNRYCGDCHKEGGIAPMKLTTYAEVKTFAGRMTTALQNGTMPPWSASSKGLPLKYSRGMRDSDRELLLKWLADGLLEGSPSESPRTDIPAVEKVQLPRNDLVVDIGGTYHPDMSKEDDIRCFLIDPKLAADTWFGAGMINPGEGSIVHHGLLSQVLAEEYDTYKAKDDADPGLGYNCIDDPPPDGGPIVTWAPGIQPLRAPAGTALQMKKTSKMLLELHYVTYNYKGSGDFTNVVLEKSAEPAPRELQIIAFGNPTTWSLRAGVPDAKNGHAVTVGHIEDVTVQPKGDMTLYTMSGHMHALGKSVRLSVDNGPIVLDVPQYNVSWQDAYVLAEPLTLHQDQTVRIDCVHDNSSQHQIPDAAGVLRPTRDVPWSWRRSDEMCIGWLGVVFGAAP